MPAVGLSKPPIMRRIVVLPAPERPDSRTRSPARRLKAGTEDSGVRSGRLTTTPSAAKASPEGARVAMLGFTAAAASLRAITSSNDTRRCTMAR